MKPSQTNDVCACVCWVALCVLAGFVAKHNHASGVMVLAIGAWALTR